MPKSNSIMVNVNWIPAIISRANSENALINNVVRLCLKLTAITPNNGNKILVNPMNATMVEFSRLVSSRIK